ncbi:30S ribosomal protein S5 [Dissostichus eleginoides]|uniref:30S ribosomal protein S5 n=1 Tax=Dissostichus eleginoides TaxID=100907 RepID=A0AAD9FHZ3_DISEL|nr:30S ribosomal protein S5 [Dissostichus eleginoides]
MFKEYGNSISNERPCLCSPTIVLQRCFCLSKDLSELYIMFALQTYAIPKSKHIALYTLVYIPVKCGEIPHDVQACLCTQSGFVIDSMDLYILM